MSVLLSTSCKAGKLLVYLTKDKLMLVYHNIYIFFFLLYGYICVCVFLCVHIVVVCLVQPLPGSFVYRDDRGVDAQVEKVEAERRCTMHSIKDPHRSIFAACSIQAIASTGDCQLILSVYHPFFRAGRFC